MRIFFSLLALTALLTIATGQPKIDSMRSQLRKATAATLQMELAAGIGKAFFYGSQYDSLSTYGAILKKVASGQDDPQMELLAEVFLAQGYARKDSALFFQQAEAVLAKTAAQQYVFGTGLMCLGIGSRLLTLGRYREAKTYLLRGYNAISDTGTPEELALKSDLIRTVSAVFHHQGQYAEALDYGLQGSRLADESREPMQRLKSYFNLSGLYGELSSPENNLGTAEDRKRYYVEAKKYMRLSYETSLRVASKMTRGATAFNLGALYQEGGQADSATVYLNEAIRVGKELNFHELLSNAFRVKAKLKNAQDSALFFLDVAYTEAELALNPMTAVSTKLDKARLLFERGQRVEAEAIAISALAEAEKLGSLNDQRSGHLLLFQLAQVSGEHRAAMTHYQRYVTVKDSMVSERNFAKIEELKTRYETELKDREIQDLEQRAALQTLALRQKNLLLFGTVMAAVLVATVLLLFYRQRTFRQQQRLLQIENRLLRFQLDPHFLSNALVSIQRFVLENHAALASSYLTKFARLMRQLLEYSRQELITIEEEIDLLRNYLDLQKLRLRDQFEYAIHVDEKLVVAEQKIPPMFAQPFVENAVEHGVNGLANGKIEIFFRAKERRLVVEIIDNGPGIDVQKNTGHVSLSTKIIRERIVLLNQSNKTDIQLAVAPVTHGTGTQVVLTLPISS